MTKLTNKLEYNGVDVTNLKDKTTQSNVVKAELSALIRRMDLKVPSILSKSKPRINMLIIQNLLSHPFDSDTYGEFEKDNDCEVSTDRVIPFPWNNDRLGSLMEMNAKELQAFLHKSPPDVIAARLNDGSLMYVIGTNGNHRSFAAKIQDLKYITVHVESAARKLGRTSFSVNGVVLEEKAYEGISPGFLLPYPIEQDKKLTSVILQLKGAVIKGVGFSKES